MTDFSSATKSGGSYTLPPPPMAELDPNASYPPPGYSSYNMAGSGSTGNGASAKDTAALVGALGLALAGGAGNGAGAPGAGTVAPTVDPIGYGPNDDSEMGWASFNNWLATQQPAGAPKVDPIGAGADPDSALAWASFNNWVATQQPAAAPTAPVPGELTTRSVTTVPIGPDGNPEGTQGVASSIYDYLVQYYGPPDTWTPEVWAQLETNLGVQKPADGIAATPSGGVTPTSVAEAADASWLADYQQVLSGYSNPSLDNVPGGNAVDAIEDILVADVPLPKPRPEPPSGGAEVDPNADMQWEPAVVGETTPLDENEKANGDPWQQLRFGEEPVPTEGAVTGSAEGPAEEPSAYDNVIDNAGKLLSHTGLGALISTLFPDLWNAGGDMMKGLDGGMGSFGGLTSVDIQNIVNNQVYSNNRPKPGVAPPEEEPPVVPPATDFPDVNNNGIDDRLEPPGSVVPAPVWDQYGQVVFPGPGYKPGLHDEWMYFRQKMAEGGVVGYADGGEVSPLAEPDPRIQVIADAEDALENMAAGAPEKDDAQAIKTFVDQFGAETLRQLQANVAEGAKMRPKRGPRMVLGPGGPKDDAIPAVIDGTQPAALSSGEFVIPAEAVAGAGEGDPVKGAKALQELSEALASRAA